MIDVGRHLSPAELAALVSRYCSIPPDVLAAITEPELIFSEDGENFELADNYLSKVSVLLLCTPTDVVH